MQAAESADSGISWEKYRKSVYGFLDDQKDEDNADEAHDEHQERRQLFSAPLEP